MSDSIAAFAESRLLRQGVSLPQPPRSPKGEPFEAQLTHDLTTLSTTEVGKLLSQMTACADYAQYVAAYADIEATSAESHMEFVTARTKLEKTGTVGEREAKAVIDPRVVEARANYLQAHAFAKLSMTLARNYDRDISTISRELTRRSLEFARQ